MSTSGAWLCDEHGILIGDGGLCPDCPHERETVGIAMSEAWWCLKSCGYHLIAPLRILPLCRLGWHDWCRCCSPVNCTRCGASGEEMREFERGRGLAR